MTKISDLKVKIFADGADLAGMMEMYQKPYIKGFTTNPTLMRKAGLTDCMAFAKDVLAHIPDRPLSLEVFSDEFSEMERQAQKLATLGSNVYVKIPITNTKRESSLSVVRHLAEEGIKVNVTAIMTWDQIEGAYNALQNGPASYISVFAGRIADTGRDPMPVMRKTVELLKSQPQIELIWASPRELLNVIQANEVGCHVITATNDILKKLSLLDKDLGEYSLETVQMFRDDAVMAGYTL